MRGVVTTEGAWGKVLALRDHPNADPAMQELALNITGALRAAEFRISPIHAPYWTEELNGTGPDAYNICLARRTI